MLKLSLGIEIATKLRILASWLIEVAVSLLKKTT